MTTLRDEILTIIAKEAHVDLESVPPDATLQDLDISSLELIEIVYAIEEHFNIAIPDRDPSFETTSLEGLVSALERFVMEKRSEQSQVPSV